MEDKDTREASWSLLPPYLMSSTGSVHLNTLRERCPTTVLEFESRHRRHTPQPAARQVVVQTVRKVWSKLSWKRTMKNNLPILKTMKNYKVSRDLLNDVFAGLTVGVTMIPQAMAFAFVATLPPIVGLYMALFSSLIYLVLGTSHHLSWNCVAVLAIMMGNLLDTYDSHLRDSLSHDMALVPNVSNPRLRPHPTASYHSVVSESYSDVLQSASVLNQPGPSSSERSAVDTPHEGLDKVTSVVSLLNVTGDDVIRSATSQNVTSVFDVSQLERTLTMKKLELACAVTLLSGVIVAVLGKLGLGKLASFMSDSLVISFTVGVSFHVLVGQLEVALGLNLPPHSGVFKIFTLSADILSHLHQTNPATLITFLLCFLAIYGVKRFINDKYAARMKVPVPVELIVVILVTAINAYMKMNETYSVTIVEEIPLGIPKPTLPVVSVGMSYLSEGMIIILVSFTQTVALAKIMALKHNYRIDFNQDMFSLGVASVVCSFFSGFIPGASITCTVVQDSAGGKTQLASLFAAGVVFLVVMFFGPYFYFLPRCVLAAIVIVNIRSMFLKLLTVPALWRKSRGDAIVWICTCVATVVLDTDLGLMVGMVVCICGVLIRSRASPVDVLGRVGVGDTHVWRSVDKYHTAQELPHVKVVGINGDFYFVNADLISDQIVKATGVNPTKLKKKGIVILVDEAQNSKGESDGKVFVGHQNERNTKKTGNNDMVLEKHPEKFRTTKTKHGSVVLRRHQDEANSTKAANSDTTFETEEDEPSTTDTERHDRMSEMHEDSGKGNTDKLLVQEKKSIHQQANSQRNGHCVSDSKTQFNQTVIAAAAGGYRMTGLPFSTLVVDFSSVSYIDMMGVGALEVLMAEYEAVGVQMFLTHVHPQCAHRLRTTGFLEKYSDRVFVTTAAALKYMHA